MYDIQSKQIFIPRGVIFHETIFPFHNVTDTNNMIDPFHDFVLPISSLEIPDVNQHSNTIPNTESNLPDNSSTSSSIHSIPSADSLNPNSADLPTAGSLNPNPKNQEPSVNNIPLRKSSRITKPSCLFE